MDTYYVSVDGNDNNQGSIDSPFATLRRAIDAINPGDTVYVREGTYYQDRSLWLGEKHSGSANSPTTIRAFPGEKVVIDAWDQTSGSLIDIEGDYIGIIGFNMINSPGHGIGIWGGDHIEIKNNVIHETQKGGIIAHGVTRDGSENRVDDLLIEGNEVYRTNLVNQSRSAISGWDSGINASRADNVTISNNRVYNNYGEGISLTLSSNSIIKDNTTFDNYSVELYLDNARDSIVERNFTYSTGNKNFFREICSNGQCEWMPSVGIQLANEDHGTSSYSLNNNTIQNNIVVGTRNGFAYGSYQTSFGIKNTLVANNTFYGAKYHTLHIDADSDNQNVSFLNNILAPGDNGLSVYIPSQEGLNFQRNLLNYSADDISTARVSTLGSENLIANPMFVNAGGMNPTDYRLMSGSEGIDAGIDIRSLTTDFLGESRLSGKAIDIGALEASLNEATLDGIEKNDGDNGGPSSEPTDTGAPEVSLNGKTLNGTEKDDILKGGKLDDILRGQGGNDILRGYSGDDQLVGAQGNDRLYGHKGNDRLFGGHGNDRLRGGHGDDLLVGGNNSDILVGAGSVIQSKNTIDTLTGGSGRDTFILGNRRGIFYNNEAKLGSSGLEDYAQITDFNKNEDSIRLKGRANLYVMDDISPIASISGKALYYDQNQNGLDSTDELIAIIQTNHNLNLSDQYFTYIK